MNAKFSEHLTDILNLPQPTLQQVLQQFETSTFGFVLCLVALPSALPIPAPGYSLPFGVMIMFVAAQLLWGRQSLWLPAAWLEKSVSVQNYEKQIEQVTKFVRFFEWFVRPRLRFIYQFGTRPLALIILLCGLAMLIPIPGTNTLPALGVFLLGLGMIEKDGLAALAGLGAACLGLTVTVTILWFGGQGVMWGLQSLGL